MFKYIISFIICWMTMNFCVVVISAITSLHQSKDVFKCTGGSQILITKSVLFDNGEFSWNYISSLILCTITISKY